VQALTACYVQQPLTSSVPTPSTRVTALLTDTGTLVMGNAIGVGALSIEGIIASADQTTWRLHLLRVDHRGGTSIPWTRELVTFPRYTLTNITEKRLSKRRSWLAAGVVTVTAFLASRVFAHIGGGEDPPDPPPPPS
jgi:hypothetical protein